MSELSSKSCVPCRGGVPPLDSEEIARLLPELEGWEVVDEHHLKKSYRFSDFREAQAFVNRVGALAEEQPGEVAEVAVHDRPRDARLARDRLDRDGVEASLGDDGLCHVEQLLAALRGGEAGGSGGRGHRLDIRLQTCNLRVQATQL